MLNHIALQVNDQKDVPDFYQDILGFQHEYAFSLDHETAKTIFDVDADVDVEIVKNEDLKLELFLRSAAASAMPYPHVCLNLDQATHDEIIEKCRQKGYEVIKVARKHGLLYFVKDHSGNLFELKILRE
jgi:catechol 2,3-dioxygenase-like lactoylglutathione lyase family enzyme